MRKGNAVLSIRRTPGQMIQARANWLARRLKAGSSLAVDDCLCDIVADLQELSGEQAEYENGQEAELAVEDLFLETDD
jgi:hypothetical protein